MLLSLLALFMPFNNPVIPEGMGSKSPSMIPPHLPTSPTPAPKASSSQEESKSDQPTPPSKDEAKLSDEVTENVSTWSFPKKDDQNPQPTGISPFSKEFLATTGLLLSGENVLLPRQVMPFAKDWRMLIGNVRFVRWQVALHPQKVETVDGLRTELVPSSSSPGNSALASRKSCSVSVFPDSPAGFTGRQLYPGRQMTMADAQLICRLMKLEDHRFEDSYPDASPTKSIASILPVFYRDLKPKELDPLLEVSKTQQTPLREVLNIKTGKWQWMYQLGEPGMDYPSPVVFSERGGLTDDDISILRRQFGGRNLDWTVYIGGCCVLHAERPLAHDAMFLDMGDKALTSVHLNVNDLTSFTSSYQLQTAVFAIPTEKNEPRQKIKPPSRDGGKESYGSFSDYVRRIVNGPAITMAQWVITGQPTIAGF